MFLLVGLLTLVFKFDRVVFLILGYEFITLSTFYVVLCKEREIISLFFLLVRVVSSLILLSMLLGIIKSYGRDTCLC